MSDEVVVTLPHLKPEKSVAIVCAGRDYTVTPADEAWLDELWRLTFQPCTPPRARAIFPVDPWVGGPMIEGTGDGRPQRKGLRHG